MAIQFVKYNPSFLDEDELVRNFVVRHADLDMILEIIQENTTQSNQHILVIGPRGSGKTTLALRVATEIDRNSKLHNTWYPLIFSEESYRATSSADFWLEALSRLADQTGEEKWIRAYEEMRSELDDQRLGDRPLWQLLDFADSQGKRILLIVENLNMLFSELLSDDEAWKMRHTLINEPRLMLLATATTRFEEIESPSRAMFEMFKIHELEPLNDEESNTIWELVAGSRLPGNQIRPVRILTGGNTRLLAIIAKFGAHRSFRQLLEDLVSLIDDHTDYFKSRIDYMPPIERKVYLALAELWRPATAREIGTIARLDVNKTSALLNRLAGRGDVVIESQSKKNRWYRIAEGIYNIYYLMRRRGRPADRVRAAIQFMVAMYGHESAGRLLSEEACRLSPESCRDHYQAFAYLLQEVNDRSILARIISTTPKSFLESLPSGDWVKKLKVPEYGPEEKNPLNSEEYEKFKQIAILHGQAFEFFKEKNWQQTLQAAEKIDTFDIQPGNLPLSTLGANVLLMRGIALGKLSRNQDAIAVYDELIQRYAEREESELAVQVARALFSKGVALGELSRLQDAIAVFDELIQRYAEREESELDIQVARALLYKGVAIGRLSRHQEAIAVFDELIQRSAEQGESELDVQVAKALRNKGVALGELSRPQDEIAVYDELIQRYAEREESELAVQVAVALHNKGVALSKLSRPQDEIAVYDELIQRYAGREESELAVQVACALYYKGVTLDELSKPQEVIAVFDELIQRYAERTEKELTDLVASALNGNAWALYSQRDLSMMPKAESLARQAVNCAPDSPHYHHTLACILCERGKGEEALISAERYVQDADAVKNTIADAIELFVALAAAGLAEQALALLKSSPSAGLVEPLVVGLQHFLGEDVRTAPEITAVAEDLVKRIEERRVMKSQQSPGNRETKY